MSSTTPINDDLVKAIASAIALSNLQQRNQFTPALEPDKKLSLDTSPLFNAKNILNWIVLALVVTFSATTVFNEIINKINKNIEYVTSLDVKIEDLKVGQSKTNDKLYLTVEALKDTTISMNSKIGVLDGNFIQITRKMDQYEQKLDKYMEQQNTTTTLLSNQMTDIEGLITNLSRKK
jgi:hypothetical protein